jgi:hypothetical protein
LSDITVNQLTTQEFYQVPKIFMTRTERKRNKEGKVIKKIKYTSNYTQLSNDAKLAYSALYSRCQLSIHSYNLGKKDYIDQNGSVFLIFTVEELGELLDKSKGTVIKIKKELKRHGLLREVSLGKNRANRLYLQLVEASHQIVEYYGETNQLEKRVDYLGREIFSSSKNLQEYREENLLSQGGSNFGPPKKEPPEVQNLDTSKNDKSKNDNYDTNRNKSLNDLSDSDIFKMGNFPFLTKETVDLISLFGNKSKSLVDKIYQTKHIVESEQRQVLKKISEPFLIDELSGELWAKEVEREVKKLIFRYKKSNIADGSKIIDITAYFYKQMYRFWQICFVIEVSVDMPKLLHQRQDAQGIIYHYFPDKITEKQLKEEIDSIARRVMQDGKVDSCDEKK